MLKGGPLELDGFFQTIHMVHHFSSSFFFSFGTMGVLLWDFFNYQSKHMEVAFMQCYN